jgi:superfamily II DNA/RNA helicase
MSATMTKDVEVLKGLVLRSPVGHSVDISVIDIVLSSLQFRLFYD